MDIGSLAKQGYSCRQIAKATGLHRRDGEPGACLSGIARGTEAQRARRNPAVVPVVRRVVADEAPRD